MDNSMDKSYNSMGGCDCEKPVVGSPAAARYSVLPDQYARVQFPSMDGLYQGTIKATQRDVDGDRATVRLDLVDVVEIEPVDSRAAEEVGVLMSCAQQSKRNAENWDRASFVRWRNSHRRCGKQIARILSANAADQKPIESSPAPGSVASSALLSAAEKREERFVENVRAMLAMNLSHVALEACEKRLEEISAAQRVFEQCLPADNKQIPH